MAKFCNSCGAGLVGAKRFCSECGASQYLDSGSRTPEPDRETKDLSNYNALDWMLRPLRKYAQFKGRSPRAEYWWFAIPLAIVLAVSNGMSQNTGNPVYFILAYLPLAIPHLAVSVRRLHDRGVNGLWLLSPWALAPLVWLFPSTDRFENLAAINFGICTCALLIQFLLPGEEGLENKYGKNPYARSPRARLERGASQATRNNPDLSILRNTSVRASFGKTAYDPISCVTESDIYNYISRLRIHHKPPVGRRLVDESFPDKSSLSQKNLNSHSLQKFALTWEDNSVTFLYFLEGADDNSEEAPMGMQLLAR